MLGFRFACARHQAIFFDHVQGVGCRDPAAMEEVRRRLYDWLAETHAAIVAQEMSGGGCIGCGLAAAQADLAAVRRSTIEIALRVVNEASWQAGRDKGKS